MEVKYRTVKEETDDCWVVGYYCHDQRMIEIFAPSIVMVTRPWEDPLDVAAVTVLHEEGHGFAARAELPFRGVAEEEVLVEQYARAAYKFAPSAN